MKKFLQVVLVPCMLFALAGCAAAPVSSLPAPSSSEAFSPSPSAEASRPTPEDPDEARLLGLLQEAAGREMMRHLYLDMDQDGEAELLGVCLNTDAHLYEPSRWTVIPNVGVMTLPMASG